MTATARRSLQGLADLLPEFSTAAAGEYRKGQQIYGAAGPCGRVYFVVRGGVLISRTLARGRTIVVGIYKAHDLFAETILVSAAGHQERAVALESTRVLSWTALEINEAIKKKPHLGLAMLQNLVQGEAELRYRIEILTHERSNRRLALALLRLAERLGTPEANGWLRMPPLTHRVISQYLGTTREIITQRMLSLRKLGCIEYSSHSILVNPDALNAWIQDDNAKLAP